MLGFGKVYFLLLCLFYVTLPAVALQGTTTYSICCEDDLECCEGPYTSTGSSETTTRPLSSTIPIPLSSSSKFSTLSFPSTSSGPSTTASSESTTLASSSQNTTSASQVVTTTSASSASTSTSSSTSSCTFSASASTSTQCATIDYLHPTQVPTVGNGNSTYDLLGCIKVDLPGNVNPLQQGGTTVKNNLTTAYCASLAMGKNYFGLIYGVQCLWSDVFTGRNYPVVPPEDCNSFCLGNYSESCGAESLLQVYSSQRNDTVLKPDSIVTPGIVVNPAKGTNSTWDYQGCFQYGFDAAYGNRDQGVSIENCANYCSDLGAPAMSFRYGNHCYCGYQSVCAQPYCDTECEAPCIGNTTEACGSDYFSLVYTLDHGS